MPEELRYSTFIGQPLILDTLQVLQEALNKNLNADRLKESLSSQIRQWEQTKTTSMATNIVPSPSHVSLLSTPSESPAPHSESSYGSGSVGDFSTRQTVR